MQKGIWFKGLAINSIRIMNYSNIGMFILHIMDVKYILVLCECYTWNIQEKGLLKAHKIFQLH